MNRKRMDLPERSVNKLAEIRASVETATSAAMLIK